MSPYAGGIVNAAALLACLAGIAHSLRAARSGDPRDTVETAFYAFIAGALYAALDQTALPIVLFILSLGYTAASVLLISKETR